VSDSALRIATWNINRPRLTSARRAPQHARIAELDADIWILTETSNAIDLTKSHPYSVPSAPLERAGDTRENWVTIWSKYPLTPIDTDGGSLTACARVDHAPGGHLIVYGTVLPYSGDPGPDGTSKGWAEFMRIVPLQAEEWRRLRTDHPDHRLCVAGDYNQSRDHRRWNGGGEYYSTKATRSLLDSALQSADLVSATDEDFVATGKLTTRSSIDHLALDRPTSEVVRDVGAWEAQRGDELKLSDHNGVWVDLALDR
jgi:exonuclease III